MSQKKISNPVELVEPIKRGKGENGQTIDKVAVRKPAPGELRGCKLANLLQLDVDELIKVLPRITEPALLEHEVAAMDAADLTDLGLEVVGFLGKNVPSRGA